MRRHRLLSFASLSLAVLAAGIHPVLAQNAAPPPPPACEAAEHRQFDFWLGEWEVTGGPEADRIVGRNDISRVASGCALREHWVNAGGQDGHSLSVYEPDARQWTHFWIGSDGLVFRLNGGLRADGAMAMEGTQPKGSGVQRHRVVWTPKPDGSVVQLWDTSDDDGKTWQVSFMGVYRRKPG